MSTLLFKTDHWLVELSPKQMYLGRAVVVAKNECGDVAELSDDQWLDLHRAVKKYEQMVRDAFGAISFNWSCLMNHAFQKKPYKPHVHWHIRPRYENAVEFEGVLFEDEKFGYHYDREEEEISQYMQNKIIDTLQKHLP